MSIAERISTMHLYLRTYLLCELLTRALMLGICYYVIFLNYNDIQLVWI